MGITHVDSHTRVLRNGKRVKVSGYDRSDTREHAHKEKTGLEELVELTPPTSPRVSVEDILAPAKKTTKLVIEIEINVRVR